MIMVIPCVVLNARPSLRPVSNLNSLAEIIKRSPSEKRCSFGPIIIRTSPFRMNITPIETITKITGATFCRL